MSTGAAGGDGLIRGLFEGCISGGDMGVTRRPYHKNCKCALHKDRTPRCHHSSAANISYPFRRTWSEGCLALMHTSTPPRPSSPAGQIRRAHTHLALYKEDDDDDDEGLCDHDHEHALHDSPFFISSKV